MLAIMMLVGVKPGKADEPALLPYDSNSFVDYFCFEGKVAKMDVSDLVNEYSKRTNDFFNEKIAAIMADPNNNVPNPSLDDYAEVGNGLCTNIGQGDLTCQSIAVCNPNTSNPDKLVNNHPYCLAVDLLGVPPVKYDHYDYSKLSKMPNMQYSYFCYVAALDRKRQEIYDSTPQGILAKCGNSEFADEDICKIKSQLDSETDIKKKADLREKLAYQLNQKGWWSTSYRGAITSLTANIIDLSDATAERIKFIDEEEARAKIALDQTLDAYSQLKSAWQLHVKYMDVFAELVKYRDYLVQIRKQADYFPLKFIDATTTKCL